MKHLPLAQMTNSRTRIHRHPFFTRPGSSLKLPTAKSARKQKIDVVMSVALLDAVAVQTVPMASGRVQILQGLFRAHMTKISHFGSNPKRHPVYFQDQKDTMWFSNAFFIRDILQILILKVATSLRHVAGIDFCNPCALQKRSKKTQKRSTSSTPEVFLLNTTMPRCRSPGRKIRGRYKNKC